MRPRQLFYDGQLSACVDAAESSPSPSARLLQVYALERLGRYGEALGAASKVHPNTSDERMRLAALEAECHLLQGETEAGRGILGELRDAPATVETQFEICYAKMLLGWVDGAPEAMESALSRVDVHAVPHLYGRWLYGRGWAAGLRGDYRKQLSWLERAVKHLQTPAGRDVALLATATRSLVHLVREIASRGSFEFAVEVAQSIPWTLDIERERFLTFRGLAWAYALRGLHPDALRYAYFARDIAPSSMWVTACYADQAYLARMAGEDRSADALLRHAISRAREIDWSAAGEERVALLNLVELAADRDRADAKHLLDIYDAIAPVSPTRCALARDSRLRAMEGYARGVLLAASGDRAAAVELLGSSYSTFISIGYAWRAAAAALRLNAATEETAWLRLAAEAVEEFPESSVAGEIRKKAAGISDPRAASLTPAQRRVYQLLCQGLGDKEIAAALRLSRETVKNHAARVRNAFGVRTRAALIAAARRNAG